MRPNVRSRAPRGPAGPRAWRDAVGVVLIGLVVGCTPAQDADVAAPQGVAATGAPVQVAVPSAAPSAVSSAPGSSPSPTPPPPSPTPPSPTPPVAAPTAADPLPDGVVRPPWLGTRPLDVDAAGNGIPAPTPPELVVRRIPTVDLLPPPAPTPDGTPPPFTGTTRPLSDADVARSTWTPDCPVDRTDLALLELSFWGFDDRPHTGEMIVDAAWAPQVVEIFRQLYDARYPIEEMRIVSAAELEGTPTGDGNVTSGFVCRPIRGSSSWSQHAYGRAVDVNPFINPYRRGDRILPELAEAYLDRDHVRPGMLDEGSVAVAAFDAIGWGWGGRWTSLIDHMHFSANGR